MYGGNAAGVELRLSCLLHDLCYIDEREDELFQAMDQLRHRRQCTAMGVLGAFRYRIGRDLDVTDEVASVYVALAHRLGYLAVEADLSPAARRALGNGLRARCRARDWRVSEVRDAFGPPTMKIGAVYAYIAPGRTPGWVFFDFDGSSEQWPARDYLLREVRTPARTFGRELTFTPYGRELLARVTGGGANRSGRKGIA
jgi:hypothetical protein